jgi:predicted exporter
VSTPLSAPAPLQPQARSAAPRHRALTLLIWLLLVLAAVWQITRTTFNADLSAFLPASPDAQQRVLIEQLQSGLPARTLLMGIDGGDAQGRANASRALGAALRNSGLFEQVQNGETQAWAEVGTWLFEHRYQLSPAVDVQRFKAAGLREGINETLALLGTPLGNAIKPLFDRDPTGETQRIAEALVPSGAPRTEGGVWASRQTGQGERALLVASTRAPGADLDAQAAAIARVKDEFKQLDQKELTLKLSGAPVFGVNSRAQIESEIKWLSIAGTALMSTLLLMAFASLPALGVAMLPVATGVLTGIVAVSLGFGSVHGITLGFGTTLIGEAVDYGIYYLIQARSSGWRAWLHSGWPTVRLGLLTSVCGFAALVFSGFPGLAQLGVFSLAGLAGAALATRLVLPVLMPNGAGGAGGAGGSGESFGTGQGTAATNAARVGLRPHLGRFAAWAVARLPRWRWPLLALGVVALVVLFSRGGLWQAQLSSLSPISKEALDLDASLRADLSAGDARALVVVQAADLQATLQSAEAVVARLETLAETGGVGGNAPNAAIGGVDSVTRWLPSLATQAARQASLPNENNLRNELTVALQGTPLTPQRLVPFINEVQKARSLAPITLESLKTSALAPVIDAMLLQRADKTWVALLPLQPAGEKVDTAAVKAALKDLPGTQTIEIGAELSRLYARYLGEAQALALLGALGVVVLIAISLRSLRRVLAVCQPLLLAVLLTMGALAALGTPLGILHLVGLLLVVAVGSNYALFFERDGQFQRRHPGLQRHLGFVAAGQFNDRAVVWFVGLFGHPGAVGHWPCGGAWGLFSPAAVGGLFTRPGSTRRLSWKGCVRKFYVGKQPVSLCRTPCHPSPSRPTSPTSCP